MTIPKKLTLPEAFALIEKLTSQMESASVTGRVNMQIIARITSELEELADRVAKLEHKGNRKKEKAK